VVRSLNWDNNGIINAGAVTWGNGATGTRGVASSVNSLVGSSSDDWVGYEERLTALDNGNYIIRSSRWDNGNTPKGASRIWGKN
jgi:hypothetical protein